MNEGLIPGRYAKALYKHATEQGTTATVYEEMKRVIASAQANPTFAKVMSNPFVSNADKEQLMLSAGGNSVGEAYKSFVTLVLNHHREEFFLQMAQSYLGIYRKENRIVLVTITTAAQLDTAEIDKIKGLVMKAYKGYTLEFNVKVNPDLIGGFVIDAESARLDASTRNEIEQLRQTLLRK